jgi:hypothetical protein
MQFENSKCMISFQRGPLVKYCRYLHTLTLKKNQKVYLQPVEKYYTVAVLLTNCHTCIYEVKQAVSNIRNGLIN